MVYSAFISNELHAPFVHIISFKKKQERSHTSLSAVFESTLPPLRRPPLALSPEETTSEWATLSTFVLFQLQYSYGNEEVSERELFPLTVHLARRRRGRMVNGQEG